MKRILYTLLLALSSVFAVWYGFNTPFQKIMAQPSLPELKTATVLSPAKPIAEFSLIDTTNQPFTERSLLGHWTLLFFGYAECPEICPRTLATLTDVWNLLPADLKEDDKLRITFVSLDPNSDTVQNLRNFLGRFHSKFVGLTGDEAMVKKFSKANNIYSWQDPNAPKTGPKIIDHSATLLLINPEGQVQALFSPPHQKEAIAKDLETIIQLNIIRLNNKSYSQSQ